MGLKRSPSVWTAYTPVIGAGGGGYALGNGSVSAKYKLDGKTLRVKCVLTWGSTSTPGTGDFTINIPTGFTAKGYQVGSALYRKSSSAAYRGICFCYDATSSVLMYFGDGAFAVMAGIPTAVANGDIFSFDLTLEVN